MLARCLRIRRIISPALDQRLVFAGYSRPAIFKLIEKNNDYLQGIGSVSLFVQRIGSVSAILVA